MKKIPTFFLKAVIVALSIGVLALCIFALPTIPRGGAPTQILETTLYIFLGAVYLSAIPFFIAAYQAVKLLNLIDAKNVFSALSLRALRVIQYCGVAISVCYVAGMPFMYYFAEEDDAPGLILIGMAFVAAPLVVSVFVSVLQKLLRAAIEIKSENDLTV